MFSRKSATVSNIKEKRMNDFHDFFLEKVGYETRIHLEHFRDIAVNPLNPGSILLFSVSVFVCDIMETGWRVFMKFSWYVRHDTRSNHLFHAWQDMDGTESILKSTDRHSNISRFLLLQRLNHGCLAICVKGNQINLFQFVSCYCRVYYQITIYNVN